MRKDLFIAKRVVYAGTKAASTTTEGAIDPYDLNEGSLGVYAMVDGGLVLLIEDDAAPTTPTGSKLSAVAATGAIKSKIQEIFIAEGLATGCRVSLPIPIRSAISMTSEEYLAGTAQSISVGNPTTPLAKPVTVVGGDTFTVHIRELNNNRETYSYSVSMEAFTGKVSGISYTTPTIAQVITEVAARVNDDSGLAITATADTTSTDEHIDFLANNAGESFEISVAGWEDSFGVVITVDTASIYPVGTYANVKAVEDRVQQYKGYHQEVDGLFPKPANRVVSGGTYDLVTLSFSPVVGAPTATPGVAVQGDKSIEIVVAFADGDNDAAGQNQADFMKVLNNLLGLAGADEAIVDDEAATTA